MSGDGPSGRCEATSAARDAKQRVLRETSSKGPSGKCQKKEKWPLGDVGQRDLRRCRAKSPPGDSGKGSSGKCQQKKLRGDVGQRALQRCRASPLGDAGQRALHKRQEQGPSRRCQGSEGTGPQTDVGQTAFLGRTAWQHHVPPVFVQCYCECVWSG
eukprot:365100-Chlamydomonas_euryale.AAC.12